MTFRTHLIALCICTCIISGCGIEWFPDSRQPDPFTLTTRMDVPTNTKVESNAVKMSHNLLGSDVSVESGEWASSNDNKTYSTWTSEPGRIAVNQWLKVRHTSSTALGTPTVTRVKVQDYSTTFVSFTTTVFSNVSTASPAVPAGTVYDSTGKVAASELTSTETAKDATKGTRQLTVSVSNTNVQAVSVTVLLQAKDAAGIVLRTATISGSVAAATKSSLTTTEEIPIAIYNEISKWEIAKVTLQ